MKLNIDDGNCFPACEILQMFFQIFQLLETAESASSDVYGLHDKIDRKKNVEKINEETQASFQLKYQEEVISMQNKLSDFVSTQKNLYNNLMAQSS